MAGLEIDADDEPFSMYGLGTLFASEYLTTALGMPFEVGKTLLQVEYKPKLGVDDGPEVEGVDYEADSDDSTSAVGYDEDSDQPRRSREPNEASIEKPEDVEAYFHDVVSSTAGQRHHLQVPGQDDEPVGPQGQSIGRDQEGYLLPDLPPSYLLRTDMSPSGSSGVWGMMRRIRRTPSEGLPGLWKGQLLTTVHSLLSNTLQPLVYTGLYLSLPSTTFLGKTPLNTDLDLPLSSYPNPAAPLGLHVTAHLLTHLFLSPFELIRTRLIVQPSSEPKSKSSIGLLRDAIAEEGGVSGLYTHPHLLIPAVLEHTLRPIFTLSIPLVIERKLGISPDASPITYSMLDLSLGLASLLIILPIETVRKRLQLQDRMSTDELWQRGGKRENVRKSIVRGRKRQYYGVVDAIWRVMTEETGTLPVSRKKREAKKRRASSRSAERMARPDEHEKQRAMFDGVKQLYRGVSHSSRLWIPWQTD